MPSLIPRWIEHTLKTTVSPHKVRLILGARQTGKSTLLQRIAPPDALVINLQDRRERHRFERSDDQLPRMLRAADNYRGLTLSE
jgi:predicted AAA+ superfamily ATPase